MSDEISPKERTFEFPMMPIFGVDLGERLGDMGARLKQLETGQFELKADVKALDARFDRVEACLGQMENRLDQTENRLDRLETKVDNMGNAVRALQGDMAEVKTDLRLLGERTKHLSTVTWGGIIVLLIAIVAQKLL